MPDNKPAICHKCGKDLKGTVPKDAEEVTCFACAELFMHVSHNEELCKDGKPHNWEGNRDLLDDEGNVRGGTTVCTKCGLDAFSHSLRYGP